MRLILSVFGPLTALAVALPVAAQAGPPPAPPPGAERPAVALPDVGPQAALPALTPLARTGAQLTISVTGLADAGGSVRIAVFDDPEGFTDRPTLAAVVPAADEQVEWVVRVPFGRYAVAVVHDADGDGGLDRNLLGMPREPYGFSNDARGVFGPPSFEDASFDVADPAVPVLVHVR